MLEEIKNQDNQSVNKAGRYQLFEITNNLEEIRIMSEATCNYVPQIYPELSNIPEWSIIPRIVMEFVKESFNFLKAKRKKDISEVFVNVGNFVHFGIEFGTTEDADKDATFNPIITVGDEIAYNNGNKTANKLKKEAPDIDYDNDISYICSSAKNLLQSKFGLFIEDPRSILEIFVAFCRIAKDYLIKHKDDDEIGIIINLGEVIDMAIEKFGDDENIQYAINFAPGKMLKVDYAKSDKDSENND